MPRPEKVQAVEDIKESFREAGAVLLTEYRGLSVKDLQVLRRNLAKAGARYRVLKNTLVRFAIRDLDYGELESFLVGPTAIAFCESDPIAPAKVINDYSRTNPNLALKASVLQGRIFDTARTRSLADLESREVLLAKVAGVVQAPLAQVLGATQALLRKTVGLVDALRAQRESTQGSPVPQEA